MSSPIVFDVGDNLIGLMYSESGEYKSFYGSERTGAIDALEGADEIITFSGLNYDIKEVEKASKELRGKGFSPKGIHTDIMTRCWDTCYGADLAECFDKIIGEKVSLPDTHLGSNEKDVYMTLKLWKSLYLSNNETRRDLLWSH